MGEIMVDTTQVDWKAIDSRTDFQELHRKKMGFLWGLMIFSLVFYFLLPIGAAYGVVAGLDARVLECGPRIASE
jgi:uncharacterized membrane protein (DUF485 family)